eukprot:c5244_g1_i1.p1 GENE.c5244_g1_i1~~c5244_g1_i1.p1  ORF type:complete len:539 (-),score=133.00 c5244_g1_i1:17-1597(-)
MTKPNKYKNKGSGKQPRKSSKQRDDVDESFEVIPISQEIDTATPNPWNERWIGYPTLGLSNLGNTCFFNAAMQCITKSRPFVTEFGVVGDVCDSNVASNLEQAGPITRSMSAFLQSLFKQSNSGNEKNSETVAESTTATTTTRATPKKTRQPISSLSTLTPTLSSLRQSIQQVYRGFRGSQQQDSHELFLVLINAIHDELTKFQKQTSSTISTPNNVIDDSKDSSGDVPPIVPETPSPPTPLTLAQSAFGSILCSVVTCQSCHNQTNTREESFVVSLEIPQPPTPPVLKKNVPSKTVISKTSKVPKSAGTASKTVIKDLVDSLVDDLVTTVVSETVATTVHDVIENVEISTAKKVWEAPSRNSVALDYNKLHISCSLDAFTSLEHLKLAEGNGFRCDQCNIDNEQGKPPILRDATKQIMWLQTPNVLVCHLKRLQTIRKITSHVEFPEVLDLEPYVWNTSESAKQKSLKYVLFGVVVHQGGRGGGHYIAYTRSSSGWYYFSDLSAVKCSSRDVLSCQAYMLFYERM